MQERRSLPPYDDELSLALLRSAEHDEPSAAAYSKVAAALGVSAAVGISASVPAQAALASNGFSSAAVRWTSSLFGKAVLVGVSGVLFVAGGVAFLRHRGAGQASAAAPALGLALPRAALASAISAPTPKLSSPVVSTLTASGVLASAPPSPLGPAVAHAPSPSLPAAHAVLALGTSPSAATRTLAASSPSAKLAATPNTPANGPPRSAKTSSLPEQVLSLDRARVALSSGDTSGALAEIAHYRNTWPRGVFLTEASVLEIEALAKRGEIVLAGMRAKAFVTAHPDCPQADRLRALIPGESD